MRRTKSVPGAHLIGGECQSTSQSLSTRTKFGDQQYRKPLQLYSEKSRTPTVAKQFPVGLCGVVEADLEIFCNCSIADLFGERLYSAFSL